jgi:DNA-directed RNA polymerase specialized sigma24 family protein
MSPPMDPRVAVDRLPPGHAAVLRGVMSGFDAHQIAALAGIPVEAVVPLVRVALAKLDQGLAGAGDRRVEPSDLAPPSR